MGKIRIGKGEIWLLAAIVLVVLPSCGMFKKWFGGSGSGSSGDATGSGEAASGQAVNQIVGEIASVFPDEGFVLIRRYGGGKLPSDAVFNTSGEGGRTASIQPTGERSGRFYAADVTAGEPKPGDVVVARRLPGGSGVEAAPVPERWNPGFEVP